MSFVLSEEYGNDLRNTGSQSAVLLINFFQLGCICETFTKLFRTEDPPCLMGS